jgi:hypothetical protein
LWRFFLLFLGIRVGDNGVSFFNFAAQKISSKEVSNTFSGRAEGGRASFGALRLIDDLLGKSSGSEFLNEDEFSRLRNGGDAANDSALRAGHFFFVLFFGGAFFGEAAGCQ